MKKSNIRKEGNTVFVGPNISRESLYFLKSYKATTIIFEKTKRKKKMGELFGFDELEKVIIPGNVSVIKDDCFIDCQNLKDIVFEKTDLKNEKGEELMITIDGFSNCPSIKDFDFLKNRKIHALRGFNKCVLPGDEFIFPEIDIQEMGGFNDCKGGKTVIFEKGLKGNTFSGFYRCVDVKNIIFRNEYPINELESFFYCENVDSLYYSNNSAKSITFFPKIGSTFKSVIFEDGGSINRIGVFSGLITKKLVIPSTVEIISQGFGKSKIDEIHFNEGSKLRKISGFSDSEIKKINLPKSIKEINNIFVGTNIDIIFDVDDKEYEMDGEIGMKLNYIGSNKYLKMSSISNLYLKDINVDTIRVDFTSGYTKKIISEKNNIIKHVYFDNIFSSERGGKKAFSGTYVGHAIFGESEYPQLFLKGNGGNYQCDEKSDKFKNEFISFKYKGKEVNIKILPRLSEIIYLI